MLSAFLIRFRRAVVVSVHLALIPLGYFAAFTLRFEWSIPEPYWTLAGETVLYMLLIRLLSFRLFGLYHGWWRHVGMQDLLALFKAVTVSSVGFVAVITLAGHWDEFPRSILVLDWLLAIFLVGGARFGVRSLRESRTDWGGVERRAVPALVVGAGEAAERLLRQLHHSGGEFRAVGLVDDDPLKIGMRLHGVPVLGATRDLPQLATRLAAQLLVIATPSASREQMQRIVNHCVETKLEFKIVPPLHELLDGRARVGQLRKVDVEDLLGRDAVHLDLASVRRDIAGKAVMITGGAGSIGSELARQISTFGPSRLILVEQAESPLYFTHLELSRAHPELEVVPLVADITDPARLERIFATYQPKYVFHAAAYKHVPLMEANAVEAVRNNVLGTLFVAECAARCGAEKVVLISTDKAVNPSSVMGATKRVAERIVLGWPGLQGTRTDFRAVRFGNVLGSEGSVVPLFKRQLAFGGPLTVTHPDVTRYFMTIPEAVQLVLQAAALPEAARRISMLHMGDPVRILELAENLVRLSGLEPYRDVPIIFTGMRPGEKLHEELMSEVEATVQTSVEKIRIVQTDEVNGVALQDGLDRLAAAAAVGDEDELSAALYSLVPERVQPLQEYDISNFRSTGTVPPPPLRSEAPRPEPAAERWL